MSSAVLAPLYGYFPGGDVANPLDTVDFSDSDASHADIHDFVMKYVVPTM